MEPSVERSERSGEATVDLGEGRQDRREVGGRWLWSVAADERRIGLKRCLELWKASREELCELGVRSQHVLLKVLLTRRRRRRRCC